MKLDSVDKLLTEEVTITKKGMSKKGLIISLALASSMALGAVGLFVGSSHTAKIETGATPINNPTVLSAVSEKVKQSVTSSNFNASEYKISGNLVDDATKARIANAMDFDIPKGLADNQIARHIAQVQFQKGNYDLSVLSYSEGYIKTGMNDIGTLATGNGENFGRQTKQFAHQLASSVNNTKEYVAQVDQVSNRPFQGIESIAAQMNTTPKMALEMSAIHLDVFKKQFIQVLSESMSKNPQAMNAHMKTGKDYNTLAQDLFNNLQPNEQAALEYHTYKVGAGGAAKYGMMLHNLIKYGLSDNKTQELKDNVTQNFTYTYKLDGQTIEQKPQELVLQSLFSDVKAFGYLVGQNVAPKNLKSIVPAYSKNNVDIKEGVLQETAYSDPLKEAQAKLLAEGKNVDAQLVSPVNISDFRNAHHPRYGGGATAVQSH